MLILFTHLNNVLNKNMFLVVMSGLICGYFVHLTDIFPSRQLVMFLFAYMTFVTSLGTSMHEFIKTLRRPWVSLWILTLVHLIAPVTAWLVGIAFYPDNAYTRIGYLIGASIPIGVTSVLWTSMVNGNLAVSLVAVTMDAFVVPVYLPIFTKIVIGQTINIDYIRMLTDLLIMVTIPSVLGMTINDITNGRSKEFADSFGGSTAKIGLFFMILLTSATITPHITWTVHIVKDLLVTLLVVATGYLVGFLGSAVLKNRDREMVLTVVYNVAIRNTACGIVIALAYFPTQVAIPLTLTMLYQQPLATLVPYLYNRIAQIKTPELS